MRRVPRKELYKSCTSTTFAFDDPCYLLRALSRLMLQGVADDFHYSFQGTWLCAI